MSALIDYQLSKEILLQIVYAYIDNLEEGGSIYLEGLFSDDSGGYINIEKSERGFAITGKEVADKKTPCDTVSQLQSITFISVWNACEDRSTRDRSQCIYHPEAQEDFKLSQCGIRSYHAITLHAYDNTLLRSIPLNGAGDLDGVEEAFFFIKKEPILRRYWIAGVEVSYEKYREKVAFFIFDKLPCLPRELCTLISMF